MAFGRSNEQWNHTASLMALIASIHSDPKSSSSPSPADFHPFMAAPEIQTATPDLLRQLGFKLRGEKAANDGVSHVG